MADGRVPYGAGDDGSSGIKTAIGGVLLAVGLLLCGWTFLRVLELLGGEEVKLVARLIPVSRASRSILLEGQQVEMPLIFFEFGAYGMAVGLLSVAATMANALLRAGAALLQPGLGRQISRLHRELLEAIGSKRD